MYRFVMSMALVFAIALPAFTQAAQGRDIMRYFAEREAHERGFSSYKEAAPAMSAPQQTGVTTSVYPTQSQSDDGVAVEDCNSNGTGCWWSLGPFMGWWKNSNGKPVAFEFLPNMMGIDLESGPTGEISFTPTPFWSNQYGFGPCEAIYGTPSLSTCAPNAITNLSDAIDYSLSPPRGAGALFNSAPITWGTADSQVDTPFSGELNFAWNGLSGYGDFDQVQNVGITPVPASHFVALGTHVLISARSGIKTGTTGPLLSSAQVTYNVGVPIQVGGRDHRSGLVEFSAYTNAPPNRGWRIKLDPGQGWFSGDAGAAVYITDKNACQVPLGFIMAIPQYDYLSIPVSAPQQAIIWAWKPNVTWPYYLRTGLALQTTGSCVPAL